MSYREARKLKIGDVIVVPKDDSAIKSVTIADIIVEEKDIFIRASDGRLYHHTAVR